MPTDRATHDPLLFRWRTEQPAHWLERCEALKARLDERAATDADGIELRRLASCRLGSREQIKLERVAQRFLSSSATPASLRRFQVGLLSATTSSYLIGPIAAAGPARGLLVGATEGPYDQIAGFAYGPVDPFGAVPHDAVVVMLDRYTFTAGEALLDAGTESSRQDGARELLAALAEAVRKKARCPLIIATLPECAPRLGSADVATVGTDVRFCALVNQMIIEGAKAGHWIVWDIAGLSARVGHTRWFDPVRYHQAKVPFAIDLCPFVADNLCALLAAMTGKAGRVIALDLDNTLWGGVIADDGVSGIRLGQNSAEGEAYVAFQRFVLALRARGVVVAVCSKNTDDIAREPFRLHPEMLLRESHIAAFRANWSDKAANLRSIAFTLNVGLDSLVFVDDNPAERSWIRQELPTVHVPEVGDDPAHFPAIIGESGVFEHLVLNPDDLTRAGSYGREERRKELRTSVSNYDEYLASLQMKMTIAPFDEIGRSRITQLINKSNQFNLTTRRYNEEDVRSLQADPDVLCWQVRLDDVFATQGMIAVVIVRKMPGTWTIDTWLQSCRILERGVEQTVMNHLIAEARRASIDRVIGEYIPTDRNGLVADFYPRLGFSAVDVPETNGRFYCCTPDTDVPRKSLISVEVERR